MGANKQIFKDTLELFRSINDMVDKFENIGLKIDFDDKSNPYATMLIKPYNILIESLDLETRFEKAHYFNSGIDFEIAIVYPKNKSTDSIDVSITEEGLFSLLEKALYDDNLAELIWNCFVDNNDEAKNTLISDYKVIGFSV